MRKILKMTLLEEAEDYDTRIVETGKLAFCENVKIVTAHTTTKS